MKGKTPLSKNKKFVVAATKSTLRIVQKMLTNGSLVRKVILELPLALRGKKSFCVVESKNINEGFMNVSFNRFLQALGLVTNVPSKSLLNVCGLKGRVSSGGSSNFGTRGKNFQKLMFSKKEKKL